MPLNRISRPKTPMIGLIVVVSKPVMNTCSHSSMNTTCCTESTDSQPAAGSAYWRTSEGDVFHSTKTRWPWSSDPARTPLYDKQPVVRGRRIAVGNEPRLHTDALRRSVRPRHLGLA